jgi:hypothetical protein
MNYARRLRTGDYPDPEAVSGSSTNYCLKNPPVLGGFFIGAVKVFMFLLQQEPCRAECLSIAC